MEISTEEIRRGVERLYRNAQNDLRNINEVHQVARFLNRLRENQTVHDNKILNKLRSLNDMIKLYHDENVDGEKQLVDLRHVYDLIEKENNNRRIIGGSLEGAQRNLLQQSIDRITRKMFENNSRMLKFLKETERLKEFVDEMNSRYLEIFQQAADVFYDLRRQSNRHRGLTPRSIRRFRLFTASITGDDQCQICLEYVSDGRRMRRLTCDGQHAFCKVCCYCLFC